MKIYINNVQVSAQILPANKPTKDETLETFSFVLMSESNKNLYAPMTPVSFVDDSNVEKKFVIVSDNIELFSLKPQRYSHTINCVERSRKLSKFLIRNSVYSQPGNDERKGHTSATFTLRGYTLTDEHYYGWYGYKTNSSGIAKTPGKIEALKIYGKEKMKDAYLEIVVHGVPATGRINNTSGIFENAHWKKYPDTYTLLADAQYKITFPSSFTLNYKDAGGMQRTTTISLTDVVPQQLLAFKFSTKLKVPKIKELADQGCNDFYISFPNDAADFIGNFRNVMPFEDGGFMAFIFVEFKLSSHIYYNSVYDVLNLLNTRHQQKYKVTLDAIEMVSSTGSVTKKESLFNIPGSATELGKLLRETIAPNFVFTQNTAYECVAEIFRLYDSIFYIDNNNNLGITYFNDLDGKRYDSLELSGFNLSIGEENYTSGLVAYYQDGRIEKEFGYAPIRSLEFGVPQEGDHHFVTDTPIEYIKEFLFRVTSGNLYTDFKQLATNDNIGVEVTDGVLELDMTDYVMERSLWELANVTANTTDFANDPTLHYQNNTVFYSKGQKSINVGYSRSDWLNIKTYSLLNAINCAFWRMIGIQDSSVANVLKPYTDDTYIRKFTGTYFKLKYITSVDGRTKIERLETKVNANTMDSLVDQFNGAIDLNKMGINIHI